MTLLRNMRISNFINKIISRTYYSFFIWGHRAGCHQRADRSFFYKNYQFPVCARCTGVLLGYVLAVVFFLIWKTKCFPSSFVCIFMLIDWLIQYLNIKESTNTRRFATGILGGYGILMFQIWIFMIFINLI